MTNIEFYNLVAAGTMNEDIMAKAQELVDKDAAAKAARKTKPKKESDAHKENAVLATAMAETVLTDEPKLTADIAAAMNITPSKATAALHILEEQGAVTKAKTTKGTTWQLNAQ